MNSLDKTLAGVGEIGTVDGSTERLMHNIASGIREAASNEAAQLSLADMIDREALVIAQHVRANTPNFAAQPSHPMSASAAGSYPDKLAVSSMTGTPKEISDWQGKNAGLREIDRDVHPDGSVTAYFRPVHDAKKDAEAAEVAKSADAAREKAAAGAGHEGRNDLRDSQHPA